MIIYKITNDINTKIYVGQTTRTLQRRWQVHISRALGGSPYAIHCAIRKYGAEHFHIEQIDVATSQSELDKKEKYWIKTLNTMAPEGYNLCEGGKTPVWNEDIRKKISGKNHWTTRKNFSLESRKKMSEAQYGAKSNNHKACMCIETGETFPYVMAVERKYGFDSCHVHDVCKGRRKRCGGYRWKYINDNEVIHNKE